MKIDYSPYRKVYVLVADEARKNYFHSDGYVDYTSVSAIEVTQNGSLVIRTGAYDVHVFAAGQWLYFNTDDMDEE